MIVLHRRGVVDEFRSGMVFQRNGLAWDGSGRQFGVNQARFETVGARRGVRIEEGTTNLLTENQSSVETDLSGVVANSPEASVARDTTTSVHGSACVRVHSLCRWRGLRLTGINLTAGTTYTFSAYVKGAVGGELVRAAFTIDGPWIMSSQLYTLTTEFRRITFTFTPTETNTYWLEICNDDPSDVEMTFYADCLQLERKPYATSWTLGGTARAAETLTVPTAGLSPAEGTISMWVYVDAQVRDISKVRRFISHFNGPGNANRITMQHNNEPHWLFTIGDDAGNTHALSFEDSYTPDGWHLLAMKWSATEFAAFVDGVKLRSVVPAYLPKSLAEVLHVGYDTSPNSHANTIISDLHISSIARSDEEILADYQRGYHVPDQYTTFYHPLDGPDSQRAARSVVL